jgi:hypothetical protein
MEILSSALSRTIDARTRVTARRRVVRRSVWRRLGLRHGETDPVIIVQAAQLRLRRWRRAAHDIAGFTQRVRRIIEARDVLLQKSIPTRADVGDSKG